MWKITRWKSVFHFVNQKNSSMPDFNTGSFKLHKSIFMLIKIDSKSFSLSNKELTVGVQMITESTVKPIHAI